MVPEPHAQPTMSAAETATAYGIGINAAYAQGRRFIESQGAEGIPALQIGRSMRFPTAAIRAHLGLDRATTS